MDETDVQSQMKGIFFCLGMKETVILSAGANFWTKELLLFYSVHSISMLMQSKNIRPPDNPVVEHSANVPSIMSCHRISLMMSFIIQTL